MASSEIENLRKLKEYLEKWIERFKAAQDLLPSLQRLLDNVNWELEALASKPDESDEIPMPDLASIFSVRFDNIKSTVPMIPTIDRDDMQYITSASTTGSSDAFMWISRVGDLETPDAKEWSLRFVNQYQEIQNAQSRSEEVLELIKKLSNPGTVARFESASTEIALFKSGTSPRTSASNEVRNLLHGVKGDLFQLAKESENENMTWERMARRLVNAGVGSPEYSQVINQGEKHSSLLSRLAQVIKDREGESLTNLDFIWTQTLDHLYSLLSLLNI